MIQDNLAIQLLDWWDRGHSDLPWRRDKDPYAVWISEVMLQQTQIATAVPYFERWMSRFPDIKSLSESTLDEVLKSWEGLGYYSRARNLHAAAQIVMDTHSGRLPEEESELIKLPGIGRYTAGAIASIAFDRAAPILDGNVTRVLSRLTDLEDDVTKSTTRHNLWKLANTLVPFERPGDYNQALMELGQRVCISAVPNCSSCPVANLCLAQKRGTQYERPVRPPRKQIPHHDVVAVVIWRSQPSRFDEILITRRQLNGMLGGLWEFPGGKVNASESFHEAIHREIAEELAVTVKIGSPICTIKHAYTHFRITLHVFHAVHVGGTPQHLGVCDHAWVLPDDLRSYAFAATDLQIIEKLEETLY